MPTRSLQAAALLQGSSEYGGCSCWRCWSDTFLAQNRGISALSSGISSQSAYQYQQEMEWGEKNDGIHMICVCMCNEERLERSSGGHPRLKIPALYHTHTTNWTSTECEPLPSPCETQQLFHRQHGLLCTCLRRVNDILLYMLLYGMYSGSTHNKRFPAAEMTSCLNDK